MTYRQLLKKLSTLSPEQLDNNLAIELTLSDECFSSTTGDVRFDIAGKVNAFLDENHPVFVLNF